MPVPPDVATSYCRSEELCRINDLVFVALIFTHSTSVLSVGRVTPSPNVKPYLQGGAEGLFVGAVNSVGPLVVLQGPAHVSRAVVVRLSFDCFGYR